MRVWMAGLFAVALAAGSLTVTRASQDCTFGVTPTQIELATGTASGSITIMTQPGCAWTVDTNATWIHLGASGGSGSGVISYAADAAAGPSDLTPRQGRVRVRWNTPTAGQDVLVTQSGGFCYGVLTQLTGQQFDGVLSPLTIGGKGGSNLFDVLADPVFSGPWRFVGAPDWITFVRPPLSVVAQGDGSAFFTVAPNPSPLPRDGVVTFCSGRTITVHQAGRSPRANAVAADFDGDGRSDIAVFRPSDGTWWILGSASNYTQFFVTQMGSAGTFPMPGDYDGDNRLDLVVYNPQGLFGAAAAGNWSVRYSSNDFNPATQTLKAFPTGSGYTPQVVPLMADINGDGRTDLVTFKGDTGEWAFYPTDFFIPSRLPTPPFPAPESNGLFQWGLPGDVPVPGDYDGDRLADLAVWRPSNGLWFIRLSSHDYDKTTPAIYQWGLPGDIPIVGDFDGDRHTDLCVWRPSDGAWYITYASTGYSPSVMRRIQWGLPGDVPVAGDYDGDGRTDLAVWRPSNGVWYILLSSTGYSYASPGIFQWGLPGDVPLSGRVIGAQ